MEIFGFDAFSPKQIAARVADVGVTKARLPLRTMSMLAMAAGGFIGLGALYYTLVAADPTLPFAITRLLGGLAFSLGLILVVIAGAELFTGNNLMVMAWADRRITTVELLRNWTIVYIANAIGAVGLAVLVYLANHGSLNGGGVATAYMKIAATKTSLSIDEAFFKGVLCNVLVCLAVWISLAGRSVTDKVLAVIFPTSAFVAAGFEHCIANMYFLSVAMLLHGASPVDVSHTVALDWGSIAHNLVPVTLGNIVGGSIMVAAVYYLIYRRAPDDKVNIDDQRR